MEIKVGDKVRVRVDAPRLYTDGWNCNWLDCDVYVTKIDGDAAEVKKICDDDEWYYLNIPLKYLIKAEEEAKEPKFKRGDKVVSKPPFVEKVWTVFGYDDKMPYMVMVGDGEYINERNLEPYTEPTEEKKLDGITEETANNLSNMLEGYCNAMQSIADNFDWQKYTADLAKEIALKVANKYNGPEEAADYAVKVAKAVADGLKKK